MKKNNPFDDLDDVNSQTTSRGRSVSQILQEIVNHLAEIVRSEIRLAGAEIRQDFAQVRKAALLLAVGFLILFYALGFLLTSVMYALQSTMPAWLSAVVVGAGLGILATVFLIIGKSRIQRINIKPDETIRSLQENVTWINRRTK